MLYTISMKLGDYVVVTSNRFALWGGRPGIVIRAAGTNPFVKIRLLNSVAQGVFLEEELRKLTDLEVIEVKLRNPEKLDV